MLSPDVAKGILLEHLKDLGWHEGDKAVARPTIIGDEPDFSAMES